MAIEWSKVQTNVVSTVIVSIVIGALIIVWRGATSVDDKVEKGIKAISETQAVLGPKVDRLESRVEQIIELLRESDPSSAKVRRRDLEPLREPHESRLPVEQMIQRRLRDSELQSKK